MASVREIRRRIRSVSNIAQVTRAMEMVAASRMRRAQEAALASRPYAAKAWELLLNLAAQPGAAEVQPLLAAQKASGPIAYVVVTADRGLAGAYNSMVIRRAVDDIRDQPKGSARVVAVGRKGGEFMARHGFDVVASFSDLPDRPAATDVRPIGQLVLDGFLSGEFACVKLVYTDFINVLVQQPEVHQLLPVPGEATHGVIGALVRSDAGQPIDYLLEQPTEELLSSLVPRLTEVRIYHGMLEARASEHSARMVAMRNATQNARDLVGDLRLRYNKVRQEAITKEMLDIAGGAEALSKS